MKTCSKCGVTTDAFYDGKRQPCKECWKAIQRAKGNTSRTDARRAYERAWYAKHHEKVIAKVRRWQASNPATEERRKRHNVVGAKWSSRNPAARALNEQRRRARIAGVGGNVTREEWRAILERHDHKCAYCGSPNDITMDHVIPISRGGRHVAENLVPACRPCNSRKGARCLEV